MTNRDRLIEKIEYLQKVFMEDDDYDYLSEFLADRLLADKDIIVPSCKVGDTVWFYDAFMWGLLPCKVDQPYHCVCGEEGGCTFSANFTDDDFGKIVFHTEEEAKEKLKETGKC